MSNAAGRLWRLLVFASYLAPRRVFWRLWLISKRFLLVRGRRTQCAPTASAVTLRLNNFVPLLRHQNNSLTVTPYGLRFSFLGRSVDMGRAVEWSPQTSPPVGQLWRMNLHYNEFLTGLSQEIFVDLTDQWITENRPYTDGYWRDAWHAYALSIRTIIWMEELASRHAGLPSGFCARVTASIEEQLHFLACNLERDIGGNHLVKNIRALATGGRIFSGASARRWTALACQLVRRELGEQFLPDGAHYERSPSYHAQVFADLLAIRRALSGSAQTDGNVLVYIDDLLRGMSQFVADVVHPDGFVPLFNDSGLHMAPRPEALLSVYQRMSGYHPAQRSNFAFPDSGYFGFRDDDVCMIVDCGRLGADPLMAHAHGDALSFELSIHGRRVVVDQGVYEYEAGVRRNASRSARSHNTVWIENSDQGGFFNAFRCGPRPRVEVLRYTESRNGFVLEGRHDGFKRTSGGPRHRRRFDLESQRLMIHDWLDAPATASVSASLLIHPDFQVTQDLGCVLIACGETRVSITTSVPTVVEPAVYWPDMGIELSTRRIRFCWPPGAQDATTELRISRAP